MNFRKIWIYEWFYYVILSENIRQIAKQAAQGFKYELIDRIWVKLKKYIYKPGEDYSVSQSLSWQAENYKQEIKTKISQSVSQWVVESDQLK